MKKWSRGLLSLKRLNQRLNDTALLVALLKLSMRDFPLYSLDIKITFLKFLLLAVILRYGAHLKLLGF